MEVTDSVGGLPVNSCGQLTSMLLHMDIEEGNGSFALFLLGELNLCALTIQMSKDTLYHPVALFTHDKRVISPWQRVLYTHNAALGKFQTFNII